MNLRTLRYGLLSFVVCLLVSYVWLWGRLFSSSTASDVYTTGSETTPTSPSFERGSSQTPQFQIPASKKGTTVIVAFCNYHFRSVGMTWYQRMTRLGYQNHMLVATDPSMAEFLERHTDFRYHVWFHEAMPAGILNKPKPKQDHAYLELLMAVRWKYLLTQLQQGMHVVLTDVDNIFNRYVDVDKEFVHAQPAIDVWHAYATKFPRKAFGQQGFVVCSGMSWWRASEAAVKFARIMQEICGDMCDDQRVLNNLLGNQERLNMTWNWTEEVKRSRITNITTTDPRFLGLVTRGLSGDSSITGHTARIWDRDFAFRGPLLPVECPTSNWVSMPILEAKSRQRAWMSKIESFQQWDDHCGTGLPKTTGL